MKSGSQGAGEKYSCHGAVELGKRLSWFCAGCRGGTKTHRGGLYTSMSKRKALFGYPNLAYRCMTIRGWSRRMYRFLWVKCTTPAGCKSIRIAVSAVMDGWSWFCRVVLALSDGKLVMENSEMVIVPERYGLRWKWLFVNWELTGGTKARVIPTLMVLLSFQKEVFKTILSF